MQKGHDIEAQRLALQAELDAKRTQAQRNRLGQFATPTPLALDLLRYASTLMEPGENIRFLDPAIGTGSFYSALRAVFPQEQIEAAKGFEIDAHYEEPASQLWAGSGLELKLADFTTQEPEALANLVICNPPYVRHHHMGIGEKTRLQARTQAASSMKVSGLAGLYCHFLGLAHAWMADGCIAGWLIPSEFMDVNYGRAVKKYLLEEVTLLRIHRFDPNDVQFADALVSSAVVWFKKAKPPAGHQVNFTFGGSLFEPTHTRAVATAELALEPKWTRFPVLEVRHHGGVPRLSEFFQIRRGIATGDNGYFILAEEEIKARALPWEAFRPILPSPRHMPHDEIEADSHGLPLLERKLFLLDTKLKEAEIQERFPTLSAYLDEGKEQGLSKRYLCAHRSPWYAQENRSPAPIVCTYLGRGDAKNGRPFRFILNHSKATIANVYLALYPTPRLSRAVEKDPSLLRHAWRLLNRISPERLLGEGRVYGGGLHKLEPKELANLPVQEIADLVLATEVDAQHADMREVA